MVERSSQLKGWKASARSGSTKIWPQTAPSFAQQCTGKGLVGYQFSSQTSRAQLFLSAEPFKGVRDHATFESTRRVECGSVLELCH